MSFNRGRPKQNKTHDDSFSELEPQLYRLFMKAFGAGINLGLKDIGVDVSMTPDLAGSFDNLLSDEIIKLAIQTESEIDHETKKMLEGQAVLLTLLSVLPNKARAEQSSNLMQELEDELSKYEAAYSNNASCYLLRGIEHQKLGENDNALEFYQKALAIDPDNTRINAYLRTLAIEVKAEEAEEIKIAKPFLGKNARKKLERRRIEAETLAAMPSQAGMFAVSGADRNPIDKNAPKVTLQSPRTRNG